jgi:hypothetical protein
MNFFSFKKSIAPLSLFLLLISLAYNSYSYLDPDFGWHLKVGENIAAAGKIPSLNLYNFTMEGKSWIDHEWLSNFLLYETYSNFGYGSVSFIFILIIILSLILLHRFCLKHFIKTDNGIYPLLILEILGISASLPHLGVRIQEITFLFLIILILLIHTYTTSKNFLLLIILPPFFYIWACLHAGFLIGLFVIIIWIITQLLSPIIEKIKYLSFIDFKKIADKKQIFLLFIFFTFSVWATFFTPYKTDLYTFIFDYKNIYYMTQISEWLPQYSFPYLYKQIFYIILAFFAILTCILFNNTKEIQNKKNDLLFPNISLWNLILFVVFLFLAIKSRRHFPLFFIVSLPIMSSFFSIFLKKIEQSFVKNKASFIIPKIFTLIMFSLFSIIILLSFLNLPILKINKDPFKYYCDLYPCEAISFLKNNPQYDNEKIFNYYAWGGYMIWEFPEQKIFIDGRMPQYKIEEKTFLEEYHTFFNSRDLSNQIEKYNIGLFLLSKQQATKFSWFEKNILGLDSENFNKKTRTIIENLQQTEFWEVIYEDQISLMYKKKSAL